MTFHDTLRHVPGRRPGRPQADPGRCAGDNIPYWFILHPILHRGGVRNGARGRRRPGRKSAQNRGFRQVSGRLPLAGRRAGGPVRRDFFQKIDRSVQLRWDGGAVVPKKTCRPGRPTVRARVQSHKRSSGRATLDPGSPLRSGRGDRGGVGDGNPALRRIGAGDARIAARRYLPALTVPASPRSGGGWRCTAGCAGPCSLRAR